MKFSLRRQRKIESRKLNFPQKTIKNYKIIKGSDVIHDLIYFEVHDENDRILIDAFPRKKRYLVTFYEDLLDKSIPFPVFEEMVKRLGKHIQKESK